MSNDNPAERAFLAMVKQSHLFDPTHERHFGSVLIAGWVASAVFLFPLLKYPPAHDAIWPSLLVGLPPLLAHGYSLRPLLGTHISSQLQPNMLAALMTLSYLPAMLFCLTLSGWQDAVFLPAAGTFMALMSFGLFLPGLLPPLAYLINAKLVHPHLSPARLVGGALLFTVAWAFSGFAAWVISTV
jgi:hypothetical protein